MIQYVTAASNGDTDAMAKLYSKTLKASYFLAATLCADEQAADITKKAYARAFCTVDKLKRPEAFEIWMKQNVAAVYKETQKFVFADAEAGTAENSSEFLSESVLEDDEQSKKVLEAVASLKPELRTALVLHYNNGMPVSALAKFLGVSESTANALLGKARAAVLSYSGLEASTVGAEGVLPVLTRIFQRKAVETSIENSEVRDIFIYAIDAYEASRPAAPVVPEAPAEEAAPEQEKPSAEEEQEPVEEENIENEPEGAPENSNIISFKQKINEILDSENIPSEMEDISSGAQESDEADDDSEGLDVPELRSSGSGDISFADFGGISMQDDVPAEPPVAPQPKQHKPKIKITPKLIGIAAAALVLVIVICVAIAGIAGDDKPQTGNDTGNVSLNTDTSSDGYLWRAGGFEECVEIVYLDEDCCYFKSATTGKYGLLDYQGNVILQPNYDGFERCGSGRDYDGVDSYHSLVKIGNQTYEFTIENGTAVPSPVPHAAHSADKAGSLDKGAAYDERDRYFEGYAAARKNDKWGYVSEDKDKKVIPYEYEAVNTLTPLEATRSDYCRGVTDGLIAVKKDGKMGIINLDNDVIVPFEYSNIMPGSNGVFIACKDGVWGVILVGDAMTSFGGVNIVIEAQPVEEPTDDAGNESMGKYEVTSSDGANVREDAGAEYDILGELDYGDTVIGYSTKKAETGKKWLKIKYNGEYGWVAMSNLEAVE